MSIRSLLETEKQHMRKECRMLETWVNDLKDSFAVELGRIAELKATQKKAIHTRMALETSHTRTPGESEVSDSDMMGRRVMKGWKLLDRRAGNWNIKALGRGDCR